MCKWEGSSDVLVQVSSCRKCLLLPLDGILQGCRVYWGQDWYTQNCVEIVRDWVPGRVSVWPIHTLCSCGMARLVCTAQQCFWWVIGLLASYLMGSHLVGFLHVLFDGQSPWMFVVVCCSDEDGSITLSTLSSSGPPACACSACWQLSFLF